MVQLMAILLTSTLFFWTVPPARALDCFIAAPPQQVEEADLVIVGTVISMERPFDEGSGQASLDLEGMVEVESYLKGSGPDRVFFFQRDLGGWEDMGVGAAGRRFLLFLSEEGPVYRTGVCRGNTLLNGERGRQALQDVVAVTGMPLQQGNIVAKSPSANQVMVASVGIVACVAITASAAVAWKIRKRRGL
jgi:hypothetical protein